MKRSFATASLIVFGLSVLFVLLWTTAESVFAGVPTIVERIATFALLVLPAGIGAVLGVLGLKHKDAQRWLALTGIVLNTLFAAFHLLLVLFAG